MRYIAISSRLDLYGMSNLCRLISISIFVCDLYGVVIYSISRPRALKFKCVNLKESWNLYSSLTLSIPRALELTFEIVQEIVGNFIIHKRCVLLQTISHMH